MKKYELIKQDYFNKLKLNGIYFIDNSNYPLLLLNEEKRPLGYVISDWQLKNMFKEVVQ